METEEAALAQLQTKKDETEEEIADADATLEEMREELSNFSEEQDEKNAAVDQAKKAALKAGKVLDQALKEITTMVSRGSCWFARRNVD